MENNRAVVHLTQVQNFELLADFGEGLPKITLDEPPPMGQGKGPDPAQLLAAAVGNCLTDSLFFALQKFKQDPTPIKTTVEAIQGRNAANRMRILEIKVQIALPHAAETYANLDRVLEQFENFCTVAESVKVAIPVLVTVIDAEGKVLK